MKAKKTETKKQIYNLLKGLSYEKARKIIISVEQKIRAKAIIKY